MESEMGYQHTVFNDCLFKMKKIRCHITALPIDYSFGIMCQSCHSIRDYELWLYDGTTYSLVSWWPLYQNKMKWRRAVFQRCRESMHMSSTFHFEVIHYNYMVFFILHEFFYTIIQFYSHKEWECILLGLRLCTQMVK